MFQPQGWQLALSRTEYESNTQLKMKTFTFTLKQSAVCFTNQVNQNDKLSVEVSLQKHWKRKSLVASI